MKPTSSSAVRVVRASLKHLDELVPLFDAYRQFYGQPGDTAGAWTFLVDRFERQESVIFIAFPDDKQQHALGFTQLYPSFSSVSMKRAWILNDLFVGPDARRGGVGRCLLERAKQWAVESGSKGLVLSTAVDNVAAQTLYESCGWKRDEQFHRYYLNV
jgi:GNAT superfamily N-acetyltransferase